MEYYTVYKQSLTLAYAFFGQSLHHSVIRNSYKRNSTSCKARRNVYLFSSQSCNCHFDGYKPFVAVTNGYKTSKAVGESKLWNEVMFVTKPFSQFSTSFCHHVERLQVKLNISRYPAKNKTIQEMRCTPSIFIKRRCKFKYSTFKKADGKAEMIVLFKIQSFRAAIASSKHISVSAHVDKSTSSSSTFKLSWVLCYVSRIDLTAIMSF